MGCWNYQLYCDDTAWDALDELLESEDLAADIERMLDEEIESADEYLNYDICQYGISDSELRELWEENEELYPKWLNNLELQIQTLK